jgi:hypothetical protein
VKTLTTVVFRGCGVVATHQLPKLRMRVRFPSAALFLAHRILVTA